MRKPDTVGSNSTIIRPISSPQRSDAAISLWCTQLRIRAALSPEIIIIRPHVRRIMEANAGRNRFDLLDGVVFTGMLGISALVGVYHAYKARKNTNAVKEYLVGGQNMSIFPISMSLIAR